MANTEELSDKPKTKRIFLNNLDSFHGRNIGKYLSRCVIGATMDIHEVASTLSNTINIENKVKAGFYEIVGTTRDREKPKPDFAKEIIQYENQIQLYEYLIECDIIIYDITDSLDQISEAVWIITEMHSDIEKIEKQKTFILLSTCMTWANTKSEQEDTSWNEDDYRKRKPHPNFKEHINAEKTVLRLGKMNKTKLVTFVICSALTYGAGENTFHYLFKAAWHNAPQLLCFGNGKNIVPTIHVNDLAAIIQNVADGWSKFNYILAKDNSHSTLDSIVKAVSNNLGSKRVKYISKEDALLNNYIEQQHFDMLLVNLKMESLSVKDSMNIIWMYETGMIDNIKHIVTEFKESRDLRPIRAVILGPPASGKSTVAKQLCDFYKLHHILIKDVIDEEMTSLALRTFNNDEIPEVEEEENSGKKDAKEAQDLLDQINQGVEDNNDRIADTFVTTFLRNRLMSMPCQNQGFVLDGYPKTIAQARILFAGVAQEAKSENDLVEQFNKNIIPEFIINLESTDSFLKQRVMNLPEIVARGSHNTEKGLLRRLKDYWAVNTFDETVLNFFDELELHSEKIDVMNDLSDMMKDTVEKIKKIFGSPRNYGATSEELEEIRKAEVEEKIAKDIQEKYEKERQEADELYEKRRRQEDWSHRLHEVKKQEYELLEVQSIPLRNYLMKHVMPTLTQALIECCKIRPDDPVDFLAEYLFQHNPQID